MTMTPRLRKFVLTAHVTLSVGWLGAVAGFLALAIAGLSGHDALRVRAAYLAMELIGWYVIVPCSFAALLTGLVQSLGTEWGLFRHYWILVKFLLTVGATILLLLHMQPVSRMAAAASEATLSGDDHRPLRIRLVADAGLALLVLLAATALSVCKPWGRIRDGQKKGAIADHDAVPDRSLNTSTPLGLYMLLGIIVLLLLFVVLHLAGGGLGH